MAFSRKAHFIVLLLFFVSPSSETSVQIPDHSATITDDPGQGAGVVYSAEGSIVELLWRYYVPVIEELSEISIAHNERHAVRFFRIRTSSFQTTNITAVYPPFLPEAFVNNMDNMTVGFLFPAVNRSMAGNYTLSIVYSNIATPAARSTVILYVAGAPVNVRVQSSYRYPLVKSQLYVQCFATSSGMPSLAYRKPLSFRWFHNGMALQNDLVPPPVLAESQAWVSKLVIPVVGEAHGGGYACQAEELGSASVSSTVRISVLGHSLFVTFIKEPAFFLCLVAPFVCV